MNTREIKFRAWLPALKKMTYAHSLEELMGWGTKKWTHGTAFWMQYTGLKDSDGIEIYEGDIIESDVMSPSEVIFYNGAFRSEKAAGPLDETIEHYGKVWVVGNIYETRS